MSKAELNGLKIDRRRDYAAFFMLRKTSGASDLNRRVQSTSAHYAGKVT